MPKGIYTRREGVWPRISPSEETRAKLRLAQGGKNNPMYGKHTSQKQKDAVRKSSLGNKHRLGIKRTPEEIRKFIESKKGYRHSQETIKKISIANKGQKRPSISGSNHPMWIKDRSLLKKREQRNDSAYIAWRREVWLRDNFTCKIANPDCNGRIEAHHILGWKSYPELRYQVNNGITLCHAHHPRKREDEAKLSPYFQSLVAEIK